MNKNYNEMTTEELDSEIERLLQDTADIESLEPKTRTALFGTVCQMINRLADGQKKYGSAWSRPDWENECAKIAWQHIVNGNLIDAMNYMFFMNANGVDSKLIFEASRGAI